MGYPYRAPHPGCHRGFTLIEVMIAVAIVAILASVAYPSYVSQVQRGKRAEARSTLLEAQQFMERQYAATDQYQANLPARLQRSPAQGSAAYNLTVTATVSAYTLTAVPLASQGSDKCQQLTLTHTNQRGTSSTAASASECWR